MSNTTEFKTPGQLIQHLLDTHEWSQRVLSIVLDIGESTINKIISGTQSVDAKLALALAEVFGVNPEDFLNLQKSYDLAQAKIVSMSDPARTNRANLFGKLPITEMIKRGWIAAKDIRDVAQVQAELTRFFKADSLDEIEVLPHAAKKTNATSDLSPVQLAWLYRVQEIADELLVSSYSQAAVESAIEKLKALRGNAEDTRRVPRILQDAGIRYVVVEPIPGSKIDGVCFWLNETSPVIAMSLRYDRIDNFWFVLRHELEHVRRLDGQSVIMMDAELEGERAGTGQNIPKEEREANAAAAEFCVPQDSLKQFVDRKAPFFHERDVIGFSRTIKVHPGLVAGQIRHKTNRFDLFGKHLVKVRSFVAANATHDGWGDVYPIGI